MNKNLFRIIFNKRRGQLMAVAETSSSQGNGTRGEDTTFNHPAISTIARVAISAIGFAALCALGAVLWALPTPVAHAQVVAYRQAPGNQQPTILQTANGVPQVNIQTPSAAGVSRNIYSQFDVESKGLILNNSHANVQTQQGGWVQANPWLATGSARIILNEVNASNPSQLNGYVEVAGQRAEVVIANPSGISVNGGGFINTSKATLTTGTPTLNSGSLESYRVQAGNISINGKGLDLSTTDYAAILSRAVQVNAGIWANELKVVTGANQIDAASLAANTPPTSTTVTGTGVVPSFALDVAQIGGMYAGKIHLIGTEQGLGVRTAGTIGSTGGDLVLQNNGWLTSTGALQASANLQITTQGNITNSGTLYASNDQTLSATGNVTNSGFIAAQGNTSITANSFDSSAKSLVAAGLKADGTLASSVTSLGNLHINTTQDLIANGQNLAAGNIALNASSVDLSGSHTVAANIAISANAGNVNTSNATVATSGTTGVLAITAKTNNDQTLDNTHGVLIAGQLNLDVANLNNAQGQITQTGTGDTTITLSSPNSILNNSGGTIHTNSANLSLSANTLTTIDGKIQHAGAGTLHITANTLNDQLGNIVSNNALKVDANVIDHRSARTAAKNITLTATSLNNRQGEMAQTGNGDMAITLTQGLDNTEGTLANNGKLTVAALSLNNNQGRVSALGDLTVNLNAARTAGASQSDGALSNLKGLVAANGDVTINAASVDNTLGTLASVDKNLSVNTTGVTTNDSGKIQAALDVTLTNAGLSNTRTNNTLASSATSFGSIAGRNIDINTNTEELNNAGGTIAASRTAQLQTGTFNNNGGLIQTGNDLVINTRGKTLTNTNTANYTNSNTALNGKGGIAAQGTSTFTTGDLNNEAGYIGSKGALIANSANITNTLGGQIQGLNNLTLSVDAGTINNTGGLIRSAAITSLSAGTVTNSNTLSTTNANLGIEGNDVAITTAMLNNNSGAIRANNNITITSAGTVDNSTGLMSAGNILTLQDVQAQSSRTLAITNTDATLLAGQSLAVAANRIGGDGSILSKGNLNLSLNADFTNSAQVIANRNATIQTTGNVTNNGKLQAGNTLNLTAENIVNTLIGEISGNTTQVNSNSTLTNRGLIDGVETQINADTVNNIGTGRIYGDHISIAAFNLTNDTETIAGVTKAGTIAARDRLDLGISGNLTNREHALIYSVGDMAVGGAIDANRRATGSATTVNNNSATIEAGGDLSLTSATTNNTNEHFTTEIVKISGLTNLLYIQPAGTTNKILAANFVFEGWSRAGQYRFKTTPPINNSAVLGASPVPRVGEQSCTGSEEDEVCTRIAGADYPRTDPAWAYFKITPPAIEPTKPNLTLPVAPDVTGASACQTGVNYDASKCTNYTNALNEYNTQKNAYDAAWATYSSAHDTWKTETDALYTALDDKIEIYNNGYASAVIRTWTQYAVTNTQSESRVASSDPSQILAGRNITLRGTNLINDKSRIVSGGVLDGDLANLNNVQGQGVHITHEVGTSQYTSSQWRGGFKRYHQRNWDGTVAYTPPDDVQSITLAVTETLQNTTPTGSGLQVATRGSAVVNTSIGAAGGTNVRANTITQNQATAMQVAANQVAGATGNKVASQITQIQTLQGFSIRSTSANTTLPTTSLYKTNPAANTLYLVETDPRFTNNKTWLGSDYMAKSLSFDPTATQKRLGDGFYEQKLIREQVAELTGRRFLANYTSDEQEYKALMDSGITFAKQYKLRPGIALTAQQMAQLTSDIVWLVEQTVTLPDGSSQKVLVPQVYVKVQPGDLDGSGTLLAGKDINLNLSGDLTNSGIIAGRNVVSLTAENVNNLGGRISGNDVSAAARQDLNNIGGTISAVNSLSATAQRDLNNQTTTQSGINIVDASSFSRTSIDRVAGLYVSGSNGTLVASAGRDLNILVGVVSNTGGGATSLKAGNNLNLQALTTHEQENSVRDANNHFKYGTSEDVGSLVIGGGNVSLSAGKDLNAKAANVQASQALTVNAGNNVNVEAGQATSNYDEAHKQTSKGFMSSSTVTTRETHNSTTALGSNLGGLTVEINAGNDIAIKGSNVLSDNDLSMTAANNITIEAAQKTSSSSNFRQETNSGLMTGGGLSISYGKQMQSVDGKDTTTTAAASTVGSVGGNVNIKAGGQYKQTGSDVLAPKGDIEITAKTVDIKEARETNKQSTEQKFEQSGLTLAVTSTVLSTLENAQSQIKATTQTSDGRMKALGSASAAANVKMAADALKAGQGDANGMVPTGNKNPDGTPEMAQGNAADKAGGIQVSLSYGQSSSQSKSTSQSDTARGSSVKAGGTTTIKAIGGGKASDLNIQGSDVSGKAVNLEADNKVNLLAAQNTNSQTSSSSNSSTSVGIALQLGTSGGDIGFTGSVSVGKGSGNGSETTFTNTHVTGADNVSIKSSDDANIRGGVVQAKQVATKIGGNLNVESLQDTAIYAEKNQQVGASGMMGAGMSGSANYAKSNINSNYASVTEQSGIKAGDGGFQVDVKGNVDLKGGAITSTQAAIENNKNTLAKGGALTTSDIQNQASYEAKSVSVSVGAGSGSMNIPGQGLSAALSGAGMGKDSGSTSSTTTAGISGIAGDTGKRTGDNAQGISKIFDADKVRQEIQAQTKITQEFGKQASTAIASYTNAQRKTLQEQVKQVEKTGSPEEKAHAQQALKDLNMQEKVLNILVGAVTGFGETIVTKENLKVAAEQMREVMIADSKIFKGVVDKNGNSLFSNQSGDSAGINGDGFKLAGTRADLEKLCGMPNTRCEIPTLPNGDIDRDKSVTFVGDYQKFKESPDGKEMLSAPFGGLQGGDRTWLFGVSYEKGGAVDKLLESFAGPHDAIGGSATGLYNKQGNAAEGRSDVTKYANEAASVLALVPAAPFAAAQGLPPEVWKAIGILLKAGK